MWCISFSNFHAMLFARANDPIRPIFGRMVFIHQQNGLWANGFWTDGFGRMQSRRIWVGESHVGEPSTANLLRTNPKFADFFGRIRILQIHPG